MYDEVHCEPLKKRRGKKQPTCKNMCRRPWRKSTSPKAASFNTSAQEKPLVTLGDHVRFP